MDKIYERRYGFLAFAALLTIWGGSGIIGDDSGYTDALYWHDYTIPDVPTGGVLEEAGFQPGDSVVSVEGIPVETLGMYSRWPRALSRSPGESIRMVVFRDGAAVEGTVVYREPPPGVVRTRSVLGVFVLSFLWLGMWQLFTTRTPHAQRFAMIGLVAAFGIPGPSLGSFNGVMAHVQVAAEILWLILLLHFFLLFPRTKRLAGSPLVGLLYAPWLVLLGCLVAEVVAHPRLYHAFGGFIGVLFFGYLVAIASVLIHTAVKTPTAQRAPPGVGLLMAGWAVALIPNLVAVVGWLVPPGFDTPGQHYFPWLLVAIPVGMALAVKRAAATQG